MASLYVVSTPIGNLEDITIRAIKVLLSSTVIACEDTRHTGMLLKLLRERYGEMLHIENDDFKPRLISVRDWNEAAMVNVILGELEIGDVSIVSDAGTPLVSDPGFKVVRAAREKGYRIVPIPGPSAAMAALSVSGLPSNKFLFWGFLPKKWELGLGITHIIYESPLRIKKTVDAITTRYPDCQIVLARELTKIHEEIKNYQGSENELRGEVTIVVYLPEK